MSEQTSQPIVRLAMSTTARPISWLQHLSHKGELDTTQPYQRGLVWGAARKRALIRSLLMGVPIPSLIVNDRNLAGFSEPGYGDRNWDYAVIDGKQRTDAIVGFLSDAFSIPSSWLRPEWVESPIETDDGPYVLHSGMTRAARRLLGNTPIGVSEGRFPSLAEEREIFDLVNFGGVAQGETDLLA